jgi:hypothetical protein
MQMAEQPFIGSEERPDLAVDVNGRVGDLTVGQLSEIFGSRSPAANLKELPVAAKDTKGQAKQTRT